MISIRCVHIQSVLDHQQLSALNGAASAGAVQRGLSQAVQSGHLGPSIYQGCCTPETKLLLVFIFGMQNYYTVIVIGHIKNSV